MAVDYKYGKVTFEHGDIADDEPVFTFREQDALLPELLWMYEEMCSTAGCPEHHLEVVRRNRVIIEEWQKTHYTRLPNSDEFVQRITKENNQ